MSYDMPFYETDQRQSKGQMIMEQTGADEATVAALLNEWKAEPEENFDIDSLLASRQESQNNQPSYQSDHQVPTFNGNATRPNALDLTRAVKYEPSTSTSSCQQSKMANQPVSPHRPPYSLPDSNVPSYGLGNTSPSTSNSRQTTPTSPYTRALHSPVSPHSHASQVSPHGPMRSVSPHQAPRSSSVSPVPYMSNVFGRYTNDAALDYYGYGVGDYSYKRQHSPGDKNSDIYRLKRERNNVAVRRSREKKKQREAENEMKVQELTDENNKLQARLDVVLKEMNLLKSLYKNIGVALPPEAQQKIEKELSKLCN